MLEKPGVIHRLKKAILREEALLGLLRLLELTEISLLWTQNTTGGLLASGRGVEGA